MVLRPTEDQWRAITALSSDVAVTAGAGSGKTWVLTERYAAMLRGRPVVLPPEGHREPPAAKPCRPGEIVAITFTEAAAADMRRKIRTRLHQLIEAGETRLLPHAEELENAPISTIHSYCASVIRRYPFEAGVDPDFAVLDEAEARRLLLEAVEEGVSDALRQEDPAIGKALFLYGRAGILRLLPEIGRAFREEGRTGAGVWDKTREALERASALWPRCRDRLLDAGRRMVEAGERVSPKFKAYETIHRFAEKWASAEAPLRTWDGRVTREWEERLRRLDKEFWSGQAVKAIAGAVEAWRAAVREALEVVQAVDLPDVTRGVCSLWDRVAERYEAKKRHRGALDYTDLQRLAVALLERPDVRRHWTASLRYVMVDEFQDTNRLQARLVDLLLEGGAKLFVVGDGKQSIYRFRGADVTVFSKTRRTIEDSGGVAVSLRHNFRSQRPILDFVNRVFAPVMGEGKVGDEPDSLSDPARISFERLVPIRPGTGGTVEVVHIAREGLPGRLAEASEVARWIRETVEGGRPVAEESGIRPAHYGDIAVLLAVSTHLPVYESALQEAGVPYRIAGSRNFFRRQEIRDLVNLLRWIYDPGDAVAMIGALRSPLFGLSDEGLMTLAVFGRGDGQGGGPDEAFADPERTRSIVGGLPLRPWDRQVVLEAAEQLVRWRRWAVREPVGPLLERIVDGTGLIPTLLQTSGGAQKAANVRRLVDMAYEGYTRGRGSLSSFLAWMEWHMEDDADEEEAQAVGAADAVTVMTVHTSKGLEFPVVVLPDLARTFRPRREMWCVDGGGALALKWPGAGEYGGFGWYRRIYEAEKRRDREEEMRKFYVALTRARDHLALFASCAVPPDQKEPLQAEKARSWFDWLVCALAGGDLRKVPDASADWPDYFKWTRIEVPEDAAPGTAAGAVAEGAAGAGAHPPAEPGAERENPAAEGTPRVPSEKAMTEDVKRRAQAILSLEGASGGWDRGEFVAAPKGGPLGRPKVVTVSASQLLEYDTCPRRYYYHWILRLPPLDQMFEPSAGTGPAADVVDEPDEASPAVRPGGGWSPLLRGMVVHRVCERWTGTEPILDRLHVVLDEFRFPKDVRRLAREEVADELLRYAESGLSKRLARAARVWSEWPFYFRLKRNGRSWDIHGQVDKIFLSDGRTVVVDFKTNRAAPEDLEPLVDHYRLQVQLYAWAVGRNLVQVDEAYLYFTDPGVLKPVAVDPDSLDATLERVDARLCRLSQEWGVEAYGFTDDLSMCRVCPYRSICPGAGR
ncbi:MAG: UvrD-helicase domain-containing protein [Kyrpidia sp.]|nr:UvrD-helicase domain-containing protein [Kyrpidia sp.]